MIIYYFTLIYFIVKIVDMFNIGVRTCLIGSVDFVVFFFLQENCTRVKFVLRSICGNTVFTGIYLMR